MRPARRALVALLLIAVAILSGGCTIVRPWERDILARKDMEWSPSPLEAALDTHIFFSKEASLAGGGAAGGGCGCN